MAGDCEKKQHTSSQSDRVHITHTPCITLHTADGQTTLKMVKKEGMVERQLGKVKSVCDVGALNNATLRTGRSIEKFVLPIHSKCTHKQASSSGS